MPSPGAQHPFSVTACGGRRRQPPGAGSGSAGQVALTRPGAGRQRPGREVACSDSRSRRYWRGTRATARGCRRRVPRPSWRSAAAGARPGARHTASPRPGCPAACRMPGSPAGTDLHRLGRPVHRPERAGRVEPRVVPRLERRRRGTPSWCRRSTSPSCAARPRRRTRPRCRRRTRSRSACRPG